MSLYGGAILVKRSSWKSRRKKVPSETTKQSICWASAVSLLLWRTRHRLIICIYSSVHTHVLNMLEYSASFYQSFLKHSQIPSIILHFGTSKKYSWARRLKKFVLINGRPKSTHCEFYNTAKHRLLVLIIKV